MLNIPSDNVRNQILEAVGTADMNKDTGVDTYLKYLTDNYGRDELYESVDRYIEFRNCVRKPTQTLSNFLMEFDQCVTRIEKKGMKLPSDVLAFELIHKANVTKDENKLVMTGLDFSKKGEMYDQAKKSIKKLLGEIGSGAFGNNIAPAIKVEPAQFVTQNVNSEQRGRGSDDSVNDVNYNSRFKSGGSGGFRGYNNFNDSHGGFIGYNKFNGDSRAPPRRDWCRDQNNPIGKDGKILECFICGSKDHLANKCPNKWSKVRETNLAWNNVKSESDDEYESMFLEINFNKEKVSGSGLCSEASGRGVLDTACASTVAGRTWIEDYINNHLSGKERDKIVKSKGTKKFKFGGGSVITSEAEMKIPAVVAGKKVMITTDVVNSEVPLLLGVKALSKAGVVLDTKDRSATFWGVKIHCEESTAGHWLVALTGPGILNDVYKVNPVLDNEDCGSSHPVEGYNTRMDKIGINNNWHSYRLSVSEAENVDNNLQCDLDCGNYSGLDDNIQWNKQTDSVVVMKSEFYVPDDVIIESSSSEDRDSKFRYEEWKCANYGHMAGEWKCVGISDSDTINLNDAVESDYIDLQNVESVCVKNKKKKEVRNVKEKEDEENYVNSVVSSVGNCSGALKVYCEESSEGHWFIDFTDYVAVISDKGGGECDMCEVKNASKQTGEKYVNDDYNVSGRLLQNIVNCDIHELSRSIHKPMCYKENDSDAINESLFRVKNGVMESQMHIGLCGEVVSVSKENYNTIYDISDGSEYVSIHESNEEGVQVTRSCCIEHSALTCGDNRTVCDGVNKRMFCIKNSYREDGCNKNDVLKVQSFTSCDVNWHRVWDILKFILLLVVIVIACHKGSQAVRDSSVWFPVPEWEIIYMCLPETITEREKVISDETVKLRKWSVPVKFRKCTAIVKLRKCSMSSTIKEKQQVISDVIVKLRKCSLSSEVKKVQCSSKVKKMQCCKCLKMKTKESKMNVKLYCVGKFYFPQFTSCVWPAFPGIAERLPVSEAPILGISSGSLSQLCFPRSHRMCFHI